MREIASNMPFDILITHNPQTSSNYFFSPLPSAHPLKPSVLSSSLFFYAMAFLKSFVLALSAVSAVTAAPMLEAREEGNAPAPMYSGTWDQFPGNETWLDFEQLVRTPSLWAL